MKKIFFTILLLGLSCEFVVSQAFESRLILNSRGYLEYQLRETTGTNPPWGDPNVWGEYDRPISDITFMIRWPLALGDDLEINLLCTKYNIIEGFPNALQHPTESYYYKLFGCDPIPVYPPEDTNYWQQNVWQTIAEMKIVNPAEGTGDFSIAPSGWIFNNLNFGFDYDEDGDGDDFTPTIFSGQVDDYPYPTPVYDRIWTGEASNRWNTSGNWINGCGDAGTTPTIATNVLVPDVDEDGGYFNPSTLTVATISTKGLTIGPGGFLTVPSTKNLNATGALIVQADGRIDFAASTVASTLTSVELKPSSVRAAGVMNILPGAKVTMAGMLTLSAASQLNIQANNTTVGSLITNGGVTHVTGGSATVQTYIKNAAAPGSYYLHTVGPTVNDPAFQTQYGYPGVYLQSFNVLDQYTYAYEYNDATLSWTNIYLTTHPVRSAKGIMLSTYNTADQTMTMNGQLVSGPVTSAPLQFAGNGLDLISNPYPSAVDFLTWQPANASAITNKYYVYNPVIGTYETYQIGSGGAAGQYINVGQGFFVETLNTGTVTFDNVYRVHNNTGIFKDIYPYQLRLDLAGNGFGDATFINFTESGNAGYDVTNDTYKWMSMLPEASEFWTVANDGSQLTMNSLPPLGSNMVSVPLSFECNTEGIHTITADNISSFEQGTDIYLEDIATGEPWHNLVQNPVYEFTGVPDSDQNRFIVHFFGPTGINDPDGAKLITIYGWGQDAFIVNRGKETIKEYVVYDLMGRELQRGSLPVSTVNKVQIGDVSAYYIVKVITKEGRIYTDKVYITH